MENNKCLKPATRVGWVKHQAQQEPEEFTPWCQRWLTSWCQVNFPVLPASGPMSKSPAPNWRFHGEIWWFNQETVVDVVRPHMTGTYWNHRMKLFFMWMGNWITLYMEPWVLHGSGPGPSSCVIYVSKSVRLYPDPVSFPAILGYVAALLARTCFAWYLHIQSLMLTQESLTIHMGTIPNDNFITGWGSQHSSARSMRP